MKTNFVIKSMEVQIVMGGEAQTVKTPEIHTEFEATMGELRGMYDLRKQAIEEGPALIKQFASEFFDALASAVNDYRKTEAKLDEALKMEAHIDAWFTEFFLAPDISKEAVAAFHDYFTDDDDIPFPKFERQDFIKQPYEVKLKFYNQVCSDHF